MIAVCVGIFDLLGIYLFALVCGLEGYASLCRVISKV